MFEPLRAGKGSGERGGGVRGEYVGHENRGWEMLKFGVGKVLKLILCISFNLRWSLFLRNKSLF